MFPDANNSSYSEQSFYYPLVRTKGYENLPAVANTKKTKIALQLSEIKKEDRAIKSFIKLGSMYQEAENTYTLYRGRIDQAEIQFQIGLDYLYGGISKQNNKKAIFWLKEAASHGDHNARYLIGSLYAYGKVVPQNLEKAEFILSRSRAEGAEDLLNLVKRIKMVRASVDK